MLLPPTLTAETADLDALGFAVEPALLSADASESVRAVWTNDTAFRSTVMMARHGFGAGRVSLRPVIPCRQPMSRS